MPSVPHWPGCTIAILATGPSLTVEDVNYVRDKARVIAINDSWKLATWADVLYSSDRLWWTRYKGVPDFKGLKFGIGSGKNKNNPFHQYPDIHVLRNTGYYDLELDRGGLRNGNNSGYAAINLAVHLGATRIVLLGYNMNHHGGKAHYFGNHPAGMQNAGESQLASRRKLFHTLVEPLGQLGIDVINCTPHTSLMAFPLGDLREVLRAQEVAA